MHVETNTPPPDDAANQPPAAEPEALAGGSADDAVIAATETKAAVALPVKPQMKVHRPDGTTATASAPAVSSLSGGAGGGGGRPPMNVYSAEPAKRRRRWPWIVGGIGALLVIAVLGVVGYGYWYVQDTVTAITHTSNKQQQEAQNGLAIAAANEPVTALIIGEDHRPGDSVSRSDTMMMVRIDPRTKTLSLLSFPRDLVVDVPG